MSRSKWKGPYINLNFFDFGDLQINKKKLIKNVSRDSVIISKFLNYSFKVYNGKKFVNVIVTKEMLGHKFGEFSETRKLFIFKKKKKNVKNG